MDSGSYSLSFGRLDDLSQDVVPNQYFSDACYYRPNIGTTEHYDNTLSFGGLDGLQDVVPNQYFSDACYYGPNTDTTEHYDNTLSFGGLDGLQDVVPNQYFSDACYYGPNTDTSKHYDKGLECAEYRHSKAEWDFHRQEIMNLITEGKSLKFVRKHMTTVRNFYAPEHHYKRRFTKWGVNSKNFPWKKLERIGKFDVLRGMGGQQKRRVYRLNKKVIPLNRLERCKKRRGINENHMDVMVHYVIGDETGPVKSLSAFSWDTDTQGKISELDQHDGTEDTEDCPVFENVHKFEMNLVDASAFGGGGPWCPLLPSRLNEVYWAPYSDNMGWQY